MMEKDELIGRKLKELDRIKENLSGM
jgi:hypothetical protein